MGIGVNQSQFYMWRTLFAVAHADNIVTDEEIAFMAQILEDVDFSDEQTSILKDDIAHAKDIEKMFKGITEHDDRTMFFDFAHDLVWVDGDFGSEEQSVMIKLFRQHFQETDVDSLVGKIKLEFEEEQSDVDANLPPAKDNKTARGIVGAFHRRFKDMFGGGD